MEAVALGLTCSLAWGVADFWAGNQSRHRPVLAILLGAQIAACCVAGAVAAAGGAPMPTGGAFWLPLAAGLLLAITQAALFRALALTAMGIAAPIIAMGAVIPAIAGLASGDRLSVSQAVGIVVAIAGVSMAARSNGAPSERRSLVGIAWAVVAMVGSGTFLYVFGRAAEDHLAWNLALSRAGSLVGALALVGLLSAWPSAGDMRRGWPVGLLDVTAYSLFGLANRYGLLSVVAVLASLYPAVTVLLARRLLQEQLRGVQVVGIALTLTGVACLAVS